MKRDHDINGTDIERLLAGELSSDSVADDGVPRFLAGLDRIVPAESTAHLEMAHMTAMIEAAHGVVSTAPVPARVTLGRTALSTIFASHWSRAAGISLAAVLAFGGTAYAGVLPSPIQNAVSAAMRPLGIVIPSPSPKPLPARSGSSGADGESSRPAGITSRPTTLGAGSEAAPSYETTAGFGIGIGGGKPDTTVKPGAPANKAANKKRAAGKAAAKRAAKKKVATKKSMVKPAPRRVTPPKKPSTTGDEAKHGKKSGSPE